jgi:Abscisic acid G-protein coupled receptor
MRTSLAAELAEIQRRLVSEQQAKSAFGRILQTISYGFSVYCIYRIIATSFAHIPFLHRDKSSFSESDPINNVLALLAKHWDPHLDRVAWSRQIGFAFSGVIIAGSLGSVMTTFNMLTRAAPGVIGHAAKGENPNLALFVSQISAVYVLASALLLRSNLPPHMSTVISEALGAPLDPAFVDRWFDGLFLGMAGLTLAGMIVGRRFGWWGGGNEFVDEMVELENGKRN